MKAPMAYLLCAWVLWLATLNIGAEQIQDPADTERFVRAAFETKKDCDAALMRGQPLIKLPSHLLCLPDTVDPRAKSN